MKYRVGLFLAIEPTWGGAFQYSLSMLDAISQLPSESFEVVVGYAHPAWHSRLECFGFKIVHIPLGSWGRFFGQLLHYTGISIALWRMFTPYFHPSIRAIMREKCDVWIFPSQDPWCYLAPVPAIATIHDLMHLYERRFPEVGNYKEFSWREWHYRNTCLWSSVILVDSTIGSQQAVESYCCADYQVQVLPYIAPSYIFKKNTDCDPLSAYSLPEKFIFYPAQFWEHKNHKRLFQAVSVVKQTFSDIKLVCVGAPKNAYSSVLKMIDELDLENNVIILGYVPDSVMGSMYKQARAMIMPTFFGPTNIPPLEAMATGCPAAVSNIYGMPEQTKGAVLLFDPESVNDISSAIERLWMDDELCQLLVVKGLQVCEEWRQQDFNKRLESIITTVLQKITGKLTL